MKYRKTFYWEENFETSFLYKVYLKRSSASSKQSIQDKVQSFSNPGSSMRVSDSAYGVQHFCLARAAIEVQY